MIAPTRTRSGALQPPVERMWRSILTISNCPGNDGHRVEQLAASHDQMMPRKPESDPSANERRDPDSIGILRRDNATSKRREERMKARNVRGDPICPLPRLSRCWWRADE